MNALFVFLASTAVGYEVFHYFCDREPLKTKGKLPRLKYKNIEILPYFRIHIRQKTFHVHHWLTLTIITSITFLAYDGLSHLLLLKGVAVGGIIQGLRYPDRFKFKHPRIQ